MNARVNGADVELLEGTTIAEVVARYGGNTAGRGIAVAVNGEVVTRSTWPSTKLSEGDRVEVLGAIGGG